jgi:HEAT repeat protein
VTSLDQALALARDPRFERRQDAARALGEHLPHPRAHSALVGMLADRGDSAVATAAASVLAAAGGEAGLTEVLRAIADGPEGLADWIGSALVDLDVETGTVRDRVLALSGSEDEAVRRGATVVLQDLPGPPA